MNTRNYPRLGMTDFGLALLVTNDLDPLYNTLWDARLEPEHLRRWLLAYWCCYSAGAASWISEQGKGFWPYMMEMAKNDTPTPVGGRWPRGRERRHFRGQAAVTAVNYLSSRYPNPEDACWSLEVAGPFLRVQEKVLRWYGFGPWISWKVADMLERLHLSAIDFTATDLMMFDSPKKAAARWFEEISGFAAATPLIAITSACDYLEVSLGGRPAPPRFERRLNIQEWETVLCKWGAHMTGHYPIGIDTRELREALHPWAAVSPTAERMLQCVPGGHQ